MTSKSRREKIRAFSVPPSSLKIIVSKPERGQRPFSELAENGLVVRNLNAEREGIGQDFQLLEYQQHRLFDGID